MTITEIILLAIALGIDCFVVSLSQGIIFTTNRLRNSLLLALSMGFAQGIMPCIGYLGADKIKNYIEPYAKWLVFGIFLVLGLKFILEAFQKKEEKFCCLDFKCLLMLSVATSIDALAAGAGLNFLNTSLAVPAVIIGIVSFIMSMSGFWSGSLLKKFPSKSMEIFGGLILIFLAVNSL